MGFIGLVPGKNEPGMEGIGIGFLVPGDDRRSHCSVGALYPAGGEVMTLFDSAYAPPEPDFKQPPDP
jgi:hypothetical protein